MGRQGRQLRARLGAVATRTFQRLPGAWRDVVSHAVVDARLALLRRNARRPRVVVLVPYARASSRVVRAFVDRVLADPAEVTVALWAWEEPAPELAAWTVGSGPGLRHQNYAALLERVDVESADWVLIGDDDVILQHGTVADLAVVADALGAVLVQPAHTRASLRSWVHNVEHACSLARVTTFVEVGPVAMIRADLAEHVVHPSSLQGWGMELYWYLELARFGPFAVVDAVSFEHLRPPGPTRHPGELDFMAELQREAGLADYPDFLAVGPPWRPWHRRPPEGPLARPPHPYPAPASP